MKLKPNIIILILLALIIFFTILIRENSRVLIAPEKVLPQEALVEEPISRQLEIAPRLAAGAAARLGITVARPLVKENKESLSGIQERDKKDAKEAFSDSTAGQAQASADQAPVAQAPDSGITKIGKHPTQKENNEMNARGIIIY